MRKVELYHRLGPSLEGRIASLSLCFVAGSSHKATRNQGGERGVSLHPLFDEAVQGHAGEEHVKGGTLSWPSFWEVQCKWNSKGHLPVIIMGHEVCGSQGMQCWFSCLSINLHTHMFWGSVSLIFMLTHCNDHTYHPVAMWL